MVDDCKEVTVYVLKLWTDVGREFAIAEIISKASRERPEAMAAFPEAWGELTGRGALAGMYRTGWTMSGRFVGWGWVYRQRSGWTRCSASLRVSHEALLSRPLDLGATFTAPITPHPWLLRRLPIGTKSPECQAPL